MWQDFITPATFMADFLLGKLLARWTRHPIYALAWGIPVSAAALLLILFLPIHGFATEILVGLTATLAIAGIFSAVLISQKTDKPYRWGCLTTLLVLLFLFPIVPLWDGRTYYFLQLRWRIHGKITNVYRSHNHNAPAIDIANPDGTTTTLENVNLTLWTRAKYGDTLSKSPNTPNGLLNNTPVRIVEQTFFH